jgi:hypothetical protein
MMNIACVRSSYDEGRTWCGRLLENELPFGDAEKAAVAVKFHSETAVCIKCSKAIIKCLGGTIG